MISILDTDRAALLQGDCLDVLRQLAPDSIDAVVTDPPYGLSFMGKAWDYDVPKAEVWAEVLRVLKPGGHLLSFFGSRTYHRGVCQIEDAGFEIRDSLIWMYGTGFPKSLNVGKAIGEVYSCDGTQCGAPCKKCGAEYTSNHAVPDCAEFGGFFDCICEHPDASRLESWGTALKPAHEPIVLARKPLIGTVAQNVLAHGTGGLNIDGCRIGIGEHVPGGGKSSRGLHGGGIYGDGRAPANAEPHASGRWPANVCLDEEAAALLDEQSGTLKSGARSATGGEGRKSGSRSGGKLGDTSSCEASEGGASRFFYTAKASRSERDRGCEHLPPKTGGEATDRVDGSIGTENPRAGAGRTGGARNYHPTVKPIALMLWLVRLVTPPGGTVLDPFMGSGTTGIAALEEGFNFIGIERDPDYCEIAKARIGTSLPDSRPDSH